MLGQTSAAVKTKLGDPLAIAAVRYNAETSLAFTDHAHVIEVGFISDTACYIIYVKKDGSKLEDLEVKGLLASEAYAEPWVATIVNPNTVDYVYQEQEDKGPVTRVLLAEQNACRCQLVIYTPNWQPDLDDLSANPLS
jgi:hypothetical protein